MNYSEGALEIRPRTSLCRGQDFLCPICIAERNGVRRSGNHEVWIIGRSAGSACLAHAKAWIETYEGALH